MERRGWVWALIVADIVLFGLAMGYAAGQPSARVLWHSLVFFAHLQMMVLLFVFAPWGIGWRSLLLLASTAALTAAFATSDIMALNREPPGVKPHQVLGLWTQQFRVNSAFMFFLTTVVTLILLPLRFLWGTIRVAPSEKAYQLSLGDAMLGTASIAVALAWSRFCRDSEPSSWSYLVSATAGGCVAGCVIAILSPRWRLGLKFFGACFLMGLVVSNHFVVAAALLAVASAHTAAFMYALRLVGYRLLK